MLKKISTKIRRKLTKTKILDRIFIDETEYRVLETTNILPSYKNKRSLSFKKDGRIYHHSIIYLNPKHHFQPAYHIPQKLISIWSDTNQVKRALVLGCAGCTLPRFISLHFPESRTTGIEISEEFINIAEKYFLLEEIDEQFELIHANAIDYIKNYQLKEKQNVIFVDIFDNNKLISDLFSDEFINALSSYTEDNSIVIFNLLSKPVPEIISFAENIDFSYDVKYLFSSKQEQNPSRFLVLMRTDNKNSITDFKEISDIGNYEITKVE